MRRIEVALPYGVDAVHLRLPGVPAREVYDLAMVVQASLLERDIPLAVNDRVGIALAVHATGVQVSALGGG